MRSGAVILPETESQEVGVENLEQVNQLPVDNINTLTKRSNTSAGANANAAKGSSSNPFGALDGINEDFSQQSLSEK